MTIERNPIRLENEEYEGIVQGVTGPKCDDCGVTYEEPPYYEFEPEACTFIEDGKAAADDEHGCTGNLCVDCADELWPEDPADPRAPAHIQAAMKGSGWT
jgi:hypothetical protein